MHLVYCYSQTDCFVVSCLPLWSCFNTYEYIYLEPIENMCWHMDAEILWRMRSEWKAFNMTRQRQDIMCQYLQQHCFLPAVLCTSKMWTTMKKEEQKLVKVRKAMEKSIGENVSTFKWNIIKHNDELQWTNERTHFFIKNIICHTLFSKGWCFLCMRDELEMGTDCYIDPKFFWP